MNIPKYKEELAECYSDPLYFVENYCLIDTPHERKVYLKLHNYNKSVIRSYKSDKKIIVKSSRQMGKTLTMICYIVWSILFKSNQTVVVLSPTLNQSSYILNQIVAIYHNLPRWMKANMIYCNKSGLALSNGSKIIIQAANKNAGRGIGGITTLCVDEMDYMDVNIQDYIMHAIAPFSEQTILLSTPNPRNEHDKLTNDIVTFDRIAIGAVIGSNDYILHTLCWNQFPNRDTEFKNLMVSYIGIDAWNREYDMTCS